jgi:hypothetical protein
VPGLTVFSRPTSPLVLCLEIVIVEFLLLLLGLMGERDIEIDVVALEVARVECFIVI